MRMFLGTLAGAALVVTAGAAQAATTVLSENFDSYTTGTNLTGQGGWTPTTVVTTNPNPIQVAGPAGGNLYAQLGIAGGQDEYKALTTAVAHNDGDSIEMAFKVTASSATPTGDYFIHLSNPVGSSTNFYERTFAKSSGAGYVLGIVDTSGTGSTPTYGTTVLDFGTQYAVDTVWNFVPGGANNDTFVMTVGGLPYLTHTWTSTATAEPAALAGLNLRQGGSTSSAGVLVDDIVVSSIAATPEPTTLGLCAGSLLGLCVRRRRHARR
jgi:hypothetical protein